MSSNNWAPDGAQIPPQSFPVLLEMEGPRAPRAPLRPAAAGASSPSFTSLFPRQETSPGQGSDQILHVFLFFN